MKNQDQSFQMYENDSQQIEERVFTLMTRKLCFDPIYQQKQNKNKNDNTQGPNMMQEEVQNFMRNQPQSFKRTPRSPRCHSLINSNEEEQCYWSSSQQSQPINQRKNIYQISEPINDQKEFIIEQSQEQKEKVQGSIGNILIAEQQKNQQYKRSFSFKKFTKEQASSFIVLIWQLKAYLESKDYINVMQKAFYFIYAYFKRFKNSVFSSKNDAQNLCLEFIKTHGNIQSIICFIMDKYDISEKDYEKARMEVATIAVQMYVDMVQKANKNRLKNLIQKAKQEINQFKQNPTQILNNKQCFEKLADLVYAWEKRPKQPTHQLTKKKKWNRIQILRYSVVLQQYESEIEKVKYKFFDQYTEFVTQGDLERISKKHNNMLNEHKNIKNIIEQQRRKYQFSEFERSVELDNLKKFQAERNIKVTRSKNLEKPEQFNNKPYDIQTLWFNIQTQGERQNFTYLTDFGELNKIVFLNDVESKIIKARQESCPQNSQILNQTWINIQSGKIQVKTEKRNEKIRNLDNQNEKNQIQTQEFGQSFEEIAKEFFDFYFENKMQEFRILQRMKNIEIIENIEDEVKKGERWTDQELFLFIMFLSIYPKPFKTENQISHYVFPFMSEFIETRTKDQCRTFWAHTHKKHKTIENVINVLKKDLKIDDSKLAQEIHKYLWTCVNTLNIFVLKKSQQFGVRNFQFTYQQGVKSIQNKLSHIMKLEQ